MCSIKPREIIQETSLSWFMHQNVNEASFIFSPATSKAEAFTTFISRSSLFSSCHGNQGASQAVEEAAIAGALQILY